MNKALIAVDVQSDFLPGGALGVPDGHKVIPTLIDMMEDVDVIVLTRDWHPSDHFSFSDDPEFVDGSWPSHCVWGTEGAQIDWKLMDAAIETGKPVLLIHKGMDVDREAYSAFDGVVADAFNMHALNKSRDDFLWDDHKNEPITLAKALNFLSVNEVRIGGLALDYCVKATAIDSRAHAGNTTVYLEATRPVGVVTGAYATYEMATKGVRVKVQ